jgi:hypothetical protein
VHTLGLAVQRGRRSRDLLELLFAVEVIVLLGHGRSFALQLLEMALEVAPVEAKHARR